MKEWEIINQKALIIIGALCAVFVITTSGILQYYTSLVNDKDQQISTLCKEVTDLDAEAHALNITVTTLTEALTQKNNVIEQKNDEITTLNNEATNLNSQINELEYTTNQSQAMIVIEDLTVEDQKYSYNTLNIEGLVKNTGESIAQNTVLLIRAYNNEGIAIETFYQIGWLAPGNTRDFYSNIDYEGSPIQSWEIMPIWTNTLVTPTSGTFQP